MQGDRIRIDGGQVYVNDEALDEDYVPPAYTDARSYPDTEVPPHCYFVLGDHRSMSNDSRDFGPVNQSYIYGKAVFGYWPMDKLGRVRGKLPHFSLLARLDGRGATQTKHSRQCGDRCGSEGVSVVE